MMELTPAMRAWLGSAEPHAHTFFLYDVVQDFRKAFGLTGGQAAQLIAQWIEETC